MPFDRFAIEQFSTGWQNNVRPHMIADDAFFAMRNATVYRRRIVKRFGTRWLTDTQLGTRLRMELTPAGLVVTTPINLALGQLFSIGSDIFTVQTTTIGQFLLTTSAVTAQVTAANQITFSAIATTVYFYPALPVMGARTLERTDINNERTIYFDTRFAYEFIANGFERVAGGASQWSGSNAQFFYSTTWRGANANSRLLFVTNYNQADGLRYLNGATWTILQPNTLDPITTPNNFVYTSRLVVVFKNRLLLLNTIESVNGVVQTFSNRCRASQIGDPTDPLAFRTDISGRGIAIDAATSEAIIGAGFLKDRLIVYFERSSWELVYTGNQLYPFVWQKINPELGCESTFSVVEFDQGILGIGDVGVHQCIGTNVARIDGKIPQEVFDIHNENDGVFRVYGIRDYFNEMVYWTFPYAFGQDVGETVTFPNRVLVYNYVDKAWSINDDTITVFGYRQPATGVLWGSTTVLWGSDILWGSGQLQSQFRQVVAGNQEGFVFTVELQTPVNAANLQITNMNTSGQLTIVNHNLVQGQYIWIQDCLGITTLNDTIFKISNVVDANTIQLDLRGIVPTGIYTGNGTVSTVSQIDLLSKQYNFYAKQNRNAYFQKIDFLVSRIAAVGDEKAKITIDYATSSSTDLLLEQAEQTNTLIGTGNLDLSAYSELYPAEDQQDRLWHPIYLLAEGEVIQLRIYYNDELMINPVSSRRSFEMHAFNITAMPTSRLQ